MQSEDMEVITSDKRQATRGALLVAARDLVFEKGHDRISVQEITQRARVATGTYYNYFESKRDIFIAVAEALRQEITDAFRPTRDNVKDPAMLVAITIKFYCYQTLDNQDWRDFTRAAGLLDISLEQDQAQTQEDIQRGIKAGRFKVDDIQFTCALISGMVRHVNQAIQNSQMPRNSIEYVVRSILQMLGLPELVSRALTQTPLPAIAAPRRQRAPLPSQVGVTHISDFTDGRQRPGSTGQPVSS